jgi:hypothetical protein
MNKFLVIFSSVLLLVAAGASKGSCAEVVGSVTDLSGHPVSGAVITAKDSSGKLLAQALANPQGHYQLVGLAPGQYDYFLKVNQLGFKDGSAVAALSTKGLTMDWKVSNQDPAVAMATEGLSEETASAGDPFGLTWAQFAGLAAIPVVAGGVIGGYAAAGGFNGPSHPGSPAL